MPAVCEAEEEDEKAASETEKEGEQATGVANETATILNRTAHTIIQILFKYNSLN